MTTTSLAARCIVCPDPPPPQFLFRKDGFDVVRCGGCGLGWTVLPEGFDPLSIYDETYFQGGQRDGYADYRASQNVLRAEFTRTLKHLRRFCPGGKLVEIGCAYGFFLAEARRHFECTGVEVSKPAVEYCRSQGLDVHLGELSEAVAARGPFDAAVMLDCFEHLPDPGHVLATLAPMMKPGGVVLITTCEFGSLYARVAGRRWRLMTPPQHLWFFTRRSLEALLAHHGFETVTSRRPWKIVPSGLAAYQVGNRLGLRLRFLERLNWFGLPGNLGDTIQIVARRVAEPPGAGFVPVPARPLR